MSSLASFEAQRLAATRDFAHTMIVVDDEAWKSLPSSPVARSGLRRPTRTKRTNDLENQQELFLVRHALDTEALVDAAMTLGLVCSVVRPPKTKSIKSQLGSAARRADIICLDWELHSDAGESATKIIAEIVRSDERHNGRLRLIAIYTGDTNNNQILEKIFNALPQAYRDKYDVRKDAVRIESNHGLRIVCLFKAHGVQLGDARKDRQVKETDLPMRLQKEFALLAGGLLSNVALATIASIRDSTHHILAKMTGAMDAPYFHHRATIPTVSDAEEYSVNIVLSDLKNAIDRHGVAHKYAGPTAISARIREIAQGAATLRLRYEANGVSREFDVGVSDAVKLVTEGTASGHGKIAGEKPGAKVFAREITTLFAKDHDSAHMAMKEFAVLTGVRAHPGSHLYKDGGKRPQLGLGTIIQNGKGIYLLCLQASCDSVRVKKQATFLFVPLGTESEKPDHVVPVSGRGRSLNYVGLSMPGTPYARSLSLPFASDKTTQTVLARKIKRRRGLFFVNTKGESYRWVADLKQRRALRAAQKLSQSLERIGFDEFEPFRQAGN